MAFTVWRNTSNEIWMDGGMVILCENCPCDSSSPPVTDCGGSYPTLLAVATNPLSGPPGIYDGSTSSFAYTGTTPSGRDVYECSINGFTWTIEVECQIISSGIPIAERLYIYFPDGTQGVPHSEASAPWLVGDYISINANYSGLEATITMA